jgi:hypothetical protein
MEIDKVGIDLGKSVFHLAGLGVTGETVVRKKFSRLQLLRFMANLRVRVVGMEACGGAHFPAHVDRGCREQSVRPATFATGATDVGTSAVGVPDHGNRCNDLTWGRRARSV